MRAKKSAANAAFFKSQKNIRPHSAGNGAFAVLPKAKKRMRSAVKRVGSYKKMGLCSIELMSSGIKSTINSIINRTLELRHVNHSRQ
jgi:hypothetical protein